MLHKLAHLFGWNTGHAYSWWDGDRLMMGFKCHGCGSIEGIHECKLSGRGSDGKSLGY